MLLGAYGYRSSKPNESSRVCSFVRLYISGHAQTAYLDLRISYLDSTSWCGVGDRCEVEICDLRCNSSCIHRNCPIHSFEGGSGGDGGRFGAVPSKRRSRHPNQGTRERRKNPDRKMVAYGGVFRLQL